MTIKTYTPLRGMLYCEDGTGDYVRTVDHLARVERLEAVADAARCCAAGVVGMAYRAVYSVQYGEEMLHLGHDWERMRKAVESLERDDQVCVNTLT